MGHKHDCVAEIELRLGSTYQAFEKGGQVITLWRQGLRVWASPRLHGRQDALMVKSERAAFLSKFTVSVEGELHVGVQQRDEASSEGFGTLPIAVTRHAGGHIEQQHNLSGTQGGCELPFGFDPANAKLVGGDIRERIVLRVEDAQRDDANLSGRSGLLRRERR